MVFEFDPTTSSANLRKHGIDFVLGQQLWLGPNIELVSVNASEERRLVVGLIGGIFWTAIITERAGATRIISIRRSRDEEKEKFKKYHG